ncbi:MAG: hypothetical protein RMJ54_14805 [Roseiflexaceae bacterium]|nr:hypothetical protein [Roseiflexus sp.]MDW8145829.1 hypothetical protein [Roseiflexaceae bacterium]MDW8234048.1 hypothetical protein [Roseiflexaceae bacterium]
MPQSPVETLQPSPAPHAIPLPTVDAFADHWARSGGEATLGKPIGEPIMLDGAPTQVYQRGLITLRPDGPVALPLPSGWVNGPPIDLARLPASAWRATLAAPPDATPLMPLRVRIAVPGYAGHAALHLYDGRARLIGSWNAELTDGIGVVDVQPGGALGAHSALLVIDGAIAGGASHLYTLDAETMLVTGQERFDALYPMIRRFMEQCVLEYALDGVLVRGYRSPDNPLLWLRDHTYQARGFRYFETDVTSLIDAFRRAQRPDGSFPDFLARPELGIMRPVRKEVEADVEYLFVQAVYEAWQMTGDDSWLRTNLDAMRRAVRYTMSDSLRWDAARGLVKRPYTIDTWDFSYGPTTTDPTTGRPAPRHWIDDQTIWGIFHGDNTGLAHALELLARIEERVGDPVLAQRWRAEAAGIMDRLNALSWNGRFFTHFVPLTPFDTPGVDEASQLSLSNAYALNRGVLHRNQGRAIVDEYFRRGLQRGETFAEWYSIDPPFPEGSFGLAGRLGERPGEYVNGGLMPLVGGELARGAFRYGAERYAFEILHRYYFLISTTGASYLWYYPAGNPGISGADTLPTDGWGSSAMLGALFEGAAGIEDREALYRDVVLSPRWIFTRDVNDVQAVARYAASDGYVAYRWRRMSSGVELQMTGSGERMYVRIPLPEDAAAPTDVLLNGALQEYSIEDANGSRYVVFDVRAPFGTIQVWWTT